MLLEREFREIFNSLGGEGVTVVLILDIEKIALLLERREVLNGINVILSFVSDKRWTMFYFVNTDFIKRTVPEILPLLEEVDS